MSLSLSRVMALSLCSLMLLAGCCSTISAPFETTTDTGQSTTEATTDATSSTDCEATPEQTEVEKFVHINHAQIKTEMARGGGEHLGALAYLLGIPLKKQAHFFLLSQANFPTLYESDQTTAGQMLAQLEQILIADASK